MFSWQTKKLISIFLIVSMVFANNGFSVLAEGVETVIEESSYEEKETPNYYEESKEYQQIIEEQTIIEEYETYLEENNPGVFENEEIEESTASDSELDEDEIEVLDYEEEIEEETEKKEESTASDSEIEKNEIEENKNEVEEATVSEIEEIIASESEIEEDIVASESEIEEDVVASESEVEEIVASESEVEKEIASASEVLNATESEAKNVIIATLSRIRWKVKKILIATYSSTYVYASENNANKVSRLATCANVIVVNEEGEEKILCVPLKWKLNKTINVNEKVTRTVKPRGVEAWRKQFKVDKLLSDNANEVIVATDSFDRVVKKIKNENEEKTEKEIIIVAEDIENKNKTDEKEEVIEKIVSTESKVKEDIVKEIFETNEIVEANETFVEETVEESTKETEEKIIEPTVADFSSTDEATISEANDSEKEEVAASSSVVTKNDIDEIKEQEQEEEKYDKQIESGVINKKEYTDYQLGFMQLETIDLYKVDTNELSAEIIKAIEKMQEKVEATQSEMGKGENEKPQSLFENILNFFGFGKNAENVNEEEVVKEEKTEEEKFLETLKNAKIETLETCEIDSLYAETDSMMFGADATHYTVGDHSARDLVVEVPASDEWLTKHIRIDYDDTLSTMWPGAPASGEHSFGGTYYLPSDITVSCQMIVDVADLEICTNGYSITFATMGYIRAKNGKKVTICNCVPSSVRASVITTTGPTYGVKDRYYNASLSDVYTKYHDRPLIEGEYIDIIGKGGLSNSNIIFKGCQIKNDYVGKNAVSKMADGHNEPDYPETSGGGSILHATKKLNIYNTKFEANIATRTNGVAINTQMSELNVEGCLFIDNINKTNVAGAIAFNPKSTTIYDSHFENNMSPTSGGALYGRIFEGSVDGIGKTIIEKTTFKNNKAAIEGGAISFDYVKDVTIGSVGNDVIFDSNKAGIYGGAISLDHTPMVLGVGGGSKDFEFEKFPGSDPTGIHGKITLDNATLNNNTARKLLVKADGKIVDAPAASMSDNAGGAIYINNTHSINYEASTTKRIPILDSIDIKDSTLGGNLAHGMEVEVKLGGVRNVKNYLNNYGGAIYVKNLQEMNINAVNFIDNKSMTGAAICAYNTELNVASGSFVGGKAYNDGDDSSWAGKTLLNKLITSGGGAIYLMDGAKANLSDNVEIKNNRNAFYLDGGEINLGASKVTGNIGEYLIGYSNYTVHPSSKIAAEETDPAKIIKPYENRILFSGVDIHNHMYYGPGKDYFATLSMTYKGASSVTHFNGKKTNTYLSFNGINSINNNKWYITSECGLTTESEVTEYCNIKLVSSTSNLKFDLSDSTMKKPPKANAAGDKGGKIGIYYYLEDPDGVDDQVVYDKWNTTDCRVFREGGIWSNYFEVDQSKRYGGAGEYIRLEGWKFYRKPDTDTIRISPNIFVVKFDSYIEGVEEIDEQYYNYKRDNQLISIATPTEIIEGAINIPGKTFIGVLGRDSSPDAIASGSYVMWDFDKCKLKAVEQEDDENDAEVMVLIYADDDVKVKACGCKSGEPCHHENGVNHADRGLAPSNSEEAKVQNYIMVATWPQLIYKQNGKRTQYVLNKDISINVDQAKKFLYGETVLNLNGYTLYVDTTKEGAGTRFDNNIFNVPLGSKSNIEEEDAAIFIVGKATTGEAARGKIVATNYEHQLIETGGAGIYISDVDIENIVNTTNDEFAGLIESNNTEKNDKQYITLNNVTFKDINIKSHLIQGMSKVIFNNVKTSGEFKLPSGAYEYKVVLLNAAGSTTKRQFKVINSDISGIDEVAALYADSSYYDAPTEVIIASSSIHDNKFKHALLDTVRTRANSTISFIGKNTIKDNTITEGLYLINAEHIGTETDPPLHLLFGDNDSVNTFESNIVPDEDNNAIIHITKKSKVSFKGINNFVNNKAATNTKETSTIYQDKNTTVNLGQTGLKVSSNNTKYNWFMERNDAGNTSAKMALIPNTKLRASESKIAIRVEEGTGVDQLILEKWGAGHLYNLNTSENVFDQDPSYGTEKPNSYKVGRGTESDIYFGNDFIIGEFRYYNYQDNIDERVSGTYDVNVAKDSIQRLQKNSYVVLDKPRIENDTDIMWEGLRTYPELYSSTTRTYDVSSESRLPFGDIRVKSDKNFELSGYKYRKANGTKHMHDETELWVEARNEGHLQATSSYAFLHNDMHISRELLYDLEGDFILCLNGHTLTIDKDMDWLKMNKNLKISICDHENGEGKITMNTTVPLTKDLITVDSGTLDLSNIEITGITSNGGRLAKVNAGANANVEAVKLTINTIDYSGDNTGDEKGFIDIHEDAIATYNNIEISTNHLLTNELNGEKQYVMSIKKNVTLNKDYDFTGLKVNSNIVEKGRGSIVHIKGYKNVVLDSIEVKDNEVISGTAIDIEGNGTGIASITNASFVNNTKNQNDNVDIDTANSANFGVKGFAKFAMQGGTITGSKYVTGKTNTGDVHTTLYIDDIESEIKGVTFDGCNVVNAGSGITTKEEGIYIKGTKNVVFEDCTFKNTNAQNYKYMHIENAAKTTLKGNTTFNSIKASQIIDVQSGSTLEFDGVTMDSSTVTLGAIDVEDGATFIASGSVLKNTNGTTINVKSDNVKIYDTEITGSGGSVPAVNVYPNKKITIGRKVVIKGYTKNLMLNSGSKIVGEETNKIADKSEISITSQENNYNFFDTWSNKYIEKFNDHNFENDPVLKRWYYLPSDVFKSDATSKQIYLLGGDTNDDTPAEVYIGDKGTPVYATLIYLDAEVRGTLLSPVEITRQYVKSTTSDTRLDRVHVNYLSTPSQYWVTPFNGSIYPDYIVPADNHKVTENIIVQNLVAGTEYKIYLSKKHIHKECGPDSTEPCITHIDSDAHQTIEHDFTSITCNADFITKYDSSPTMDSFGLDKDVTIKQDALDKLSGRNVYICLHGHVLTFDPGVKMTTSNKLVITDCTGNGYITASLSEATDTLINTTGELKIYNTTFKSFDADKSVIVAGGKLYFENSTFSDIRMTSVAAGPIVKLSGNNYFDRLSINHITSTYSSLLVLDSSQRLESTKITTFDISNNTYSDKLISIDAGAHTVPTFTANNNIMVGTASGVYGTVYIGGGSLEFTEDFVMKGNDASGNEYSKGGAFTINGGNLIFDKKMLLENNKSAYGGAIYLGSSGNLEVKIASNSTFKNNEAKYGAAIYAEGLTDARCKIPEAVFDGNKSTGNGVFAWGGTLTLNKIRFINQRGKSIIYNINNSGDTLTVDNVVFANNAVDGDAIELNQAGVVTIQNINEKTKNNTFRSFVAVNNTSAAVNIKDSYMTDNTYGDATIKVSTSSNVTLTNLKLTANRTANGALSIQGNPVTLVPPMYIAQNRETKDIFVKGDNAYVIWKVASGKLASPSRLGFSAAIDGVKVFEKWNASYIDKYDDTDETKEGSRKYAHTPENSEVVYASADAGSKNYELYKNNEDLYIGSSAKFAKVSFIYDEEGPTVTYLTQNIARNVSTKLDKVNVYGGIPLNKQRWDVYKEDGTPAGVTWNFDNAGSGWQSVNTASPVVAKYIKPHLHKVCGYSDCAEHADFTTHTGDIEYERVRNVSAIEASGANEYFALENDIYAEHMINIAANYKGMCLNGHKIIASGSMANVINVLNTVGEFTICDCKHIGGFAMKETATVSNAFANNSNNSIAIYGVVFDNVNMENAYVATAVNNVTINGATFSNIKKMKKDGILDSTKANNFANITFINNILETDSTFIDMNNIADKYRGNLKLINNKTKRDFIKLYGVGGIDIKDIYLKANTTDMSIIVATNSALKAKGTVDLIGNITKKSVINLNNTPFDFENTSKINAEDNTNNGNILIDGEGRGGAIYMVNNSSFKTATSSRFINNKAGDGAAIYARDLSNVVGNEHLLVLIDTTFERNGILGTEGHGVINYNGYLDIKDVTFKENQGTELIYAGCDTLDTLKVTNATFVNNNTSKDAIYIKKATDSSFKEYIGVNSTGNTFTNLINIATGSITLSDIDIEASNNKYNNAILNITDGETPALSNVIIKGAQGNIGAAIKLNNTRLKARGKIVVDVAAGKNIILTGDSYLKGYDTGNEEDKISSDSMIHITSAGMETKVFDGWNEKNIESVNKPKYEPTNTKYMYIPENAELFMIDDGKAMYKKGTNSDIYVGNDYIELTFIRKYNDEDDPEEPYPDITLGVQRIAKSVETLVDRVDIYDYAIKHQEWEAPGYPNWKFVDKATGLSNEVKADYAVGKSIYLVSKHIHRICGGKLTTVCEHDNDPTGFDHEDTPIFIKIKTLASVSDAIAEANLTPGEKHYISLTGDIRATLNNAAYATEASYFNSIFSQFDGLCLNGHSIMYIEPDQIERMDGSNPTGIYDPADSGVSFISINRDFSICDCKSHKANHGKFTNDMKNGNPGIKWGRYISVENGKKLALYNIHFDGTNVKDHKLISPASNNTGCLIYTANINSVAYLDKVEITNIIESGEYGLFSGRTGSGSGSPDRGKVILSSPSIIGNNLGTCNNPIIQLNERIVVSSMSVIGNNGLGGLIDVSGNPVSIGKMYVQGNSSNGNGIITIPYGSKLIITEENEFVGNSKSIKGGVFYISGELEVNKEVSFIENTSNGSGGAVYITGYADDGVTKNPTSGKIIAHATMSFIKNIANDGATIYADNIDDDALTFEKPAIFDANLAKTNVFTWKGDLNLSNVIFKNHKSATNKYTYLLQNANNGAKLKLSDVTFINNEINGLTNSMVILKNIASPSYITNIHSDESTGNKADNLFDIQNNSAIEIKDVDVHGFSNIKSLFKIDNSPKTVLSNVKINDNHTANGAVYVSNGALGIKDKIEISGNDKDLYLADGSSYLKGVGDATTHQYIDDESKIVIDTYGDNAKIFEGWNEYNIEKYDKPDKHETPIEYMHTPEGNAEHPGIFVSKNSSWKVYKSGLDGDVKLGTNFVTLTFSNRDPEKPEDIEDMYFGNQTQNIEKGVETRIDKVNSFEYEVGRQDFRAPSNTDESVTTTWHFPDPTLAVIHPEIADPTKSVTAKYENSHEIIYVYKHIHKICGLTLLDDCDHTYGANHDPVSDTDITTVEYTAVDSVSGPNGINNVADSVEYIGLKNDIVIDTENIKIKPSIKGICLNGHSIISKGGSSSPITLLAGRGANDLEICNCRNHKEDSAFTLAENKTLNADYIKLSENNIRVNIRKVKFSKIDTSKPIINIAYPNDKIMLEDVTFKEIKGVGSEGVLSVSNPSGYEIANLNFVSNNNQTTGPLVTLAQGMQISTVSFVGNTLKGSAFAISGTPIIGSLDVRNNETTANGIINVPSGATLQIDKAITFDHNKAENGGAIYVANGGKFVASDKATFTNNTAVVNGGALYLEAGAIVNLNGDVRFENNTAVDGSSIYAERLSAGNLTMDSSKEIIFTKEKATGKGVIAWGGELTLASSSFVDNMSGCGELLANIHTDGSDKLNINDGILVTGNNGIKGVMNLDHVGASALKNIKIDNNTFTNAGLYIVNDSEITMDTPVITGNTSGTYGAVYIKDTDKVKTIGNVTITGNKTTGSYGAAVTLENVHSFENLGTGAVDSKLDISNNKSASGGAVYLKNAVMAVAGIVNIVGNTLNNNAARNIYITDADSYMTASDWIEADSKMGYTVATKNFKVFEGWNATNFHKYDNPDSNKTTYTPENSGIFIADAGLNFYKSGTGDGASIKLGDNYAVLTFCTSDKANIYATQNIEKNVDTKLDVVKANHSSYGSEKWVAPEVITKWIFSDGDIVANYNANQYIIKSFIYHIRFSAGSKEGKPGLSGYMDNATYEYGDTVTIPDCAYTYEDPDTHILSTFRKWRIKTAVTGMPTEFAPGEANIRNLSIGEGHDVVLEVAWVGEYAVRYFPNGEKIGQSIAYDESFNVVGSSGVPTTIVMTYPEQVGNYKYSSYTSEPNGGATYGIGATVTGNDNEIKLYCNWSAIPQNNNNEGKKRGGGGGGGGGGSGRSITSSGGMWINGVWVPFAIDPLHPTLPTQGQYYVDAYGNIKAPTGEIVGNVNLGDKVNTDGTFTDVNGNTHLLDGAVRDINGIVYNIDGSLSMPDGRVYYVDGSIKDKDGTVYNKDGSVKYVDGTWKDGLGLLHRADGSIMLQDGTIYYTDGSIEYPDGSKLLPDGTLIKGEKAVNKAAQKKTDGAWEYDPVTGGWRFFNVDNITGKKAYYKDDWISSEDKNGNLKWYAVDTYGNMVTGWVKVDGDFYYMSPSADTRGELMKGNITIAGKTYKLDPETGKLLDNQIPNNFNVLGAENHRSGIDGYWKTNPATGKKQFIKQNKRVDGKLINEEPVKGWYMVDGYYYNFSEDGDANTGLIVSDGKYYYMEADGHMLEGGERVVGKITYVFDKATGACRSSYVDPKNL